MKSYYSFCHIPQNCRYKPGSAGLMSVNVPPYSNLQAAIVYDFGNTYINFRMLHYGKIYYFYYKIFDSMGNVAADGYIKHKFHDDTDDYNDITMFDPNWRSEEHTSELQSRPHLVCRLLLEKKKKKNIYK